MPLGLAMFELDNVRLNGNNIRILHCKRQRKNSKNNLISLNFD